MRRLEPTFSRVPQSRRQAHLLLLRGLLLVTPRPGMQTRRKVTAHFFIFRSNTHLLPNNLTAEPALSYIRTPTMKLHSTLFVIVAGALLTMGTAFAGFMEETPGHRYSEYCLDTGSMVNEPHACFETTPAILKKFSTPTTKFKGYLGPNGLKFVLLPFDEKKGGLAFETAHYTIDISEETGFYTSIPKCNVVTIRKRGEAVPFDEIQMCGAESLDFSYGML